MVSSALLSYGLDLLAVVFDTKYHLFVRFVLNMLTLKLQQCSTEFKEYSFVTQGLKTRHMSFLAFLFNHILHCVCFKILFTESKYLVSN